MQNRIAHSGKPAVYFASMVGVLVFANWVRPGINAGVWFMLWANKWLVAAAFAVLLGLAVIQWFGAAAWCVQAVAGAAGIVVDDGMGIWGRMIMKVGRRITRRRHGEHHK